MIMLLRIIVIIPGGGVGARAEPAGRRADGEQGALCCVM